MSKLSEELTRAFERGRLLKEQYKGRKLTDVELQGLGIFDRLALCTCEIQIPGPVTVDPECIIHWDMAVEDEARKEKFRRLGSIPVVGHLILRVYCLMTGGHDCASTGGSGYDCNKCGEDLRSWK